ncbi:HofO family protein [Erwinia sorbitola]|uniref:DNA utilization protein HofO C-terminal domain-containing protein n=1 Tax=Erwinia sorbitola TaxID=2681984 RepID=A0A6I6EHH3_9GAMM|nr:hypothetical protein [Erwinia sorbitola]QGU85991.1 hypothetical protein GN242_01540 [Erwinia sorbitola]
MMHRWLIGWLQIAAWQRLTSFSIAALLLATLIWLGWLRPGYQQQQQLEKQRQQLTQRYHQQRRLLQDIPALFILQQQAEKLRAELLPAENRPFSLPALLNSSGAVLESWRPSGQWGELTVTLDWVQFLALLDYLSVLQPVPLIPQFSLQRKEQRLHLVMELTDEN